MPHTPSARDAIMAALALARGESHSCVAPGPLPSARSRLAVERLVEAGSIDALTATRPDMRALLGDLLDWNGAKATKATVRAAGAALTSRAPDGRSRYPQAVEMLSFAATVAPLLEPDRVARVISAAGTTRCVYAPIRYPATTAAALRRLAGHYHQARLEVLLVSLWEVAHDGRWWDVCGGLGRPSARRRRRRNSEEPDPDRDAAVAAASAAITRSYGTADGDLVGGLLAGEVVYTPPTLDRLAALHLPTEAYSAVAAFASADHDDPDRSVLAAALADLAPADRPPSPIPVLVESLEFMLGGSQPADVLPKKPAGWGQLYPDASMEPYPFPDEVAALDWAQLPGTGPASGQPPAVVEWCRNPHALFQNREYMGNCTGGYDSRCRAGTCFIGKVHFDGEIYNFSVDRRGDSWYVSQVNSRFNRGAVPPVLTQALNRAVDAIVVAPPA